MIRALLAVLPILGALSQSIKSCGGPSDHLSNITIKLTPDPIQKGQPFTMDLVGDLGEDTGDISMNIDLTIRALGIVHASVSGSYPVSISPSLPKGPQHVSIGPVSLPTGGIPGSAVVKGKVHIVNGKSEPVACMDIDMTAPFLEEAEASQPSDEFLAMPTQVQDIRSCGKPSDHISDATIATSGGVTTVTGTLDEALSKGSLDVDLTMKVLFISVPMKMTAPFTYTPGVPKGALKASLGPGSIVTKPNPKASVKGTVKLNNDNSQEIACLNIDTVTASADLIAV